MKTKAIKESIHVKFDKSNPKTIQVEVVDYAGIQEKTSTEDDQELNQAKNENQVIEEELVQDQTPDTPQENPYLPKE